ncbi:hypothetical protein [Oceanobacillus jordanicus]|uniref:Uncharacterized protein n=1 Tax=Oceanobacillus jordanicus TaxID=2867266 RepID=A0AAW5B6M2_9BACI|nr:hypothetical protein [Oceanobacillus jordanicus]MCG3420051.1 hypothetical protein [Oceanobacillus jordanicus]
MISLKNPVESILGVDVRIKRPIAEIEKMDKGFSRPIIHRQIHGDEVYVPLNLWSR